MIFRPAQLGMAKLDRLELEQDKKACRKIGPWCRQKGPVPQQLLHRPRLCSALWQHLPRVQAGGHEFQQLYRQGMFASKPTL